LHVRLKNAGLDAHAEAAQLVDKFFIQAIGLLGRSGTGEAGASLSARIAIESELGDNERRSATIHERAIHLPFRIGEDSEVGGLLGKVCGGFVRVANADTQQHDEAGTDFSGCAAFDGDACAADSLDDGSHFSTASGEADILPVFSGGILC
jgi:hypothetical protein